MEEQNVESNIEKVEGQNVSDSLNQQVTSASTVAPLAQSAVIAQVVPSVEYAGFWIRLLAAIIDGIVVSMIAIPIAAAFYFLSGGFFVEGAEMESPMGFNFLGYAISWGYYILMTDKYQATLGKKAMGIVVVAEDLSKLPLGKIILRETVGKVVSGIIFGIGYIMAAFTSRKRALHDIISGTVVIYKEPGAKIHKGVIIGVVVACILFFVVIIGILSSIVLISLSGARDKTGVAVFKSEAMSLWAGSVIVCDEEILTQEKPANASKYLGERNFIKGTKSTDCGPNGSGEFNFTVDSIGLPEKCTAKITEQGVTFEGC